MNDGMHMHGFSLICWEEIGQLLGIAIVCRSDFQFDV